MPLELFPYQVSGAAWIASRERCGLLDIPGLGKTAQCVRAVDLRRLRRGVVVCPAHLRENWRGEFAKFACLDRRICKAETIHDFVAWSRGIFDVLLVSYERAVRWLRYFYELGELIEFVVLDEAHYVNNSETARTRAVLGEEGDGTGGLVQWAVQAFWVTGTLMTNDPANCYNFLRFCRAMTLSYPAFVHRYFYTRTSTYGQRNKPRPDMLPELQMLITNNSIRRTFEQVGVELPPIFLTTTLVDGDARHVRDMLATSPGLEQAIVDAVQQGGLSFLDSQHVATLRRLIAEAKARPYTEMLLEELRTEPDRKVVVMGISRDALIHVRDVLAKHQVWCVLVQGGVSEHDRVEAVRAFQECPQCRVFVGNMRASGTGLTLHSAAHIDVLESDWAPAVNDQAIRRVRRIGQWQVQHARFVTLARSLDETVNRIVAEKTAAIAMVEGDGMVSGPVAA